MSTKTSQPGNVFAQTLRAYRQLIPLPQWWSILTQECPDWHEYEAQEAVLHTVLQDPHVVKYPPSLPYRVKIGRSYFDAVCQRAEDVSDGLAEFVYELEAHALAKKRGPVDTDTEIEYYYRTFTIPSRYTNTNLSQATVDREDEGGDVLITTRVTQSFHQVGTMVWEGGSMLAEWLLANADIMQGKHVLELGSGIGLTGAALAFSHPPPASIVLTDYNNEVNDNLQANLANCHLQPVRVDSLHQYQQLYHQRVPDIGNTTTNTTTTTTTTTLATTTDTSTRPYLAIARCDWEDEDHHCHIGTFSPDVILAADCVYNKSLARHLVFVLVHLLTNNPACQAYIVSHLRQEETYKGFLLFLVKQGLAYEEVPESQWSQAPHMFPYNRAPGSLNMVRIWKPGSEDNTTITTITTTAAQGHEAGDDE